MSKRHPEMLGSTEAPASTAQMVEYLRSRRPSAVLEGDELPMLVRFGDLANPRSVETLTPGARGEIGPNVRLRQIRIEITDDEVTEGVEQKLPWITTLNGSLSGELTRHPGNPAQDLPAYAFTRGLR